MKVFTRFPCLLLGLSCLGGCQEPDSMGEPDSTIDPPALYKLDTIARPGVADSIHFWIVPNHMLWIPLEFEESNCEVFEMRLP